MSSPFYRQTLADLEVYPDFSPQYIPANKSPSQASRGAVNATPTPVQDMGVDHGRLQLPKDTDHFPQDPEALPFPDRDGREGLILRLEDHRPDSSGALDRRQPTASAARYAASTISLLCRRR
jgi:hypothetical protein